MRLSYEYDGEVHHVDVERGEDGAYHAAIDGRRYTFQLVRGAQGALLLRFEDGRQVAVHATRAGRERYIYCQGELYTLTVPDRRRKRSGGAGGGDLTAQMPGQVIEVLVTAGEQVDGGQTLVVLEAMKMELRITAPTAGVVKQVSVKVGDMVERGQTLVAFTAAE